MTLHIINPSHLTAQCIAEFLPEIAPEKVLLKPNWVLHATHEEFPIDALVTSSSLIETVVDACFQRYPTLRSLLVGDVPLQSCEFDLLCAQSGIDGVRASCEKKYPGRVHFMDFRRERYVLRNGFLVLDRRANGDPAGYAEIVLDERSLLDEVSHNASRFRVSDYDPEETKSVHQKGSHRYLIARSVLDADLVINLPKMKTHQKSGVTGALKNLVGINGSKAYLVHHQIGKPSQGGDEFPESASHTIVWQVRLREFLQKRSPIAFKTAKAFWEVVKRIRGIKTVGTRENLKGGNVYIGAGSWHGNDSVWRMVYDLNLILIFGKREGGRLADTPQRRVLSIMDGVVSGEGNGPLQPIPVQTDTILCSENPFLIDFAMAKMMGFDWTKIPLLSNHLRFGWGHFAKFDPHGFAVENGGSSDSLGVDSIPILRRFLPPPGWRDHIELR